MQRLIGFFVTVFFILNVSAPPLLAEAAVLSDKELLDLVEEKAFRFFWDEANPVNGLVKDKALNFKEDRSTVASVASVGFALTAYPIGAERGWITPDQAYERTLRTLQFFLYEIEQVNGFYYHFVDMKTGERAWKCELSPIDTALFVAGALFAGEYFKDTEIESLARQLYERIDWQWMTNNGTYLSLCWSPETEFSHLLWNHYCESMIMYLLAIGSPTHPIPADAWKAIRRPVGEYGGYRLIQCPPLFTHQYSHLWIDFRGIDDNIANYFENSKQATLANRAFCIDNKDKYKTYSEEIWGLTSSDGPDGYKGYGAQPGDAVHDGTIAPTAAISSIMFTPELSMRFIRYLYENYKDKFWGNYGFCDSFNLDRRWRSQYVIGIDQGAILLGIENYRSGFVWRVFKKIPWIKDAMKKVGFRRGRIDLHDVARREASAAYSTDIEIDGTFSDWSNVPIFEISKEGFQDYGTIASGSDLSAEVGFAWDEEYLYLYAEVKDDFLISRKKKDMIYQDDLVELFIDPACDGFKWKNRKDIQIGFSPMFGKSEKVKTWAWFQRKDPSEEGLLDAAYERTLEGYIIEAGISWSFLGIDPAEGGIINVAVGTHDIDKDKQHAKYTWGFYPSSKDQIGLAKVVLER